MKKGVAYYRYSCDKQNEQSIEGQMTVCRQYAESHDILIVGEYIDRAVSGTSDNREEFQRMIKDSHKKEWECVIVYKGDRFARNRIESAINKKTLHDNGVKVVSATENIPDSPEGIIMESLLEGMAEYYSAELSQKVRRGMAETKKKGLFTGGKVRFGYDIVDRRPVINAIEANIITYLCEEYTSGRNVSDIQASIGTDKHGRVVSLDTLYRALDYASRVDQVYPPIISEALRAKLASYMASKKRAPRMKPFDYILSGKTYCAECKAKMTGATSRNRYGKTYYYYQCKHHRISRDYLDNLVIEACRSVIDGGFIDKVVDRAYAVHQADYADTSEIERLQAHLKDTQKTLDNIMSAIEKGIFNDTTKDRMDALEADKAATLAKIEEAKNKTPVERKQFREFLLSLVDKGGEDFARGMVDVLVRNVIVFTDKIRITFNYTPNKTIPLDESELSLSETEQGSPHANCTNLLFFMPNYWGIVRQKNYP